VTSFRTEVRHEIGAGKGCIICYLPTVREALEWAMKWPDAVVVHISPQQQTEPK
jgi:hypothetical protein